MRFAGKVWRLLVGVKDGLVLLFMLLFFGFLYMFLSASPTVGSAHGALLISLDGPVVEQPADISFSDLLTSSGLVREYRLRDLVHALKTAATDDRVEAVVLDLDIFAGGGQTALASVGEAMETVKRAGKPVLAHATAYDDDSYQLAAHATEVWLDPMGGVMIAGPGGTNPYFKGLLDRIGVTANVYKAGTYKAAVEPYTRSDMSPEAREASQALAASLWESWQQDVRQARPKAQLAAYVASPAERVAEAGGDMARAALAAGLVDRLGDRTAFGSRVAEIAGTGDEDVPGSYRSIDYEAWVLDHPSSDDGGQIGILTVAGEIVDGEAGAGTAGAETIVRNLEEGLKHRNIKALVLRVDSPGGSVLASERIRRAVMAAKARKLPVLVSMGNLAASGGYWVATPADHIFAEPSTITGSIGVFGILPSFQGTLAKLGVGADGVKTTPLSGEPDILQGPSPAASRMLQMGVDNMYRRFLALVSEARRLPVERVDRIAQGRVWDGGTARQLGLIDSFGSLDDAIAEAARRAKLDPAKAKAVYLEREPGFIENFLFDFGNARAQHPARDAFSRLGDRPDAMLIRALGDADRILSGPAVQARCLDCPGGDSARRPSAGFSPITFLLGVFGP
ncbi:signal peptide peptidase SppA [Sphingosinicella rhizophila]|uniref:Signal peptide peptidase SppA n=1 Tax=Sphingosinicella rhizophila TaxID=3050082 RepID=A0ABU3Q3U2_9SPHN|nr:signal peptide peptidase SppA [Sphingosinicella sp. GR2756]MDT9597947.1 signal peptide peptidase SppA [Sphingosinicella sp. GR2756]